MSYELMKCEVTGNEFGDSRELVAISKHWDDLIKYCKAMFDTVPVQLSSLNCPIPEHRHRIVNDTYYTIIESKVEVVDHNYLR